jgi:hypothetical protein
MDETKKGVHIRSIPFCEAIEFIEAITPADFEIFIQPLNNETLAKYVTSF